ncbi:putative protein-lysine deacylase ABHD14B isoform X1 [Branchiostoma floridae x Branchiostoma japonicum]
MSGSSQVMLKTSFWTNVFIGGGLVFLALVFYLGAIHLPNSDPEKSVSLSRNQEGGQDGVVNMSDQIYPHIIEFGGARVWYQEKSPPNPKCDVLLLHGQAFISQTWVDLGTVDKLAAAGCRVVGLDLPGYGKSWMASRGQDPIKAPGFLHKFITAAKMNKPFIVSPSMSGSFSMSHLMEHPDDISGFIPVAPMATENYKPDDYKKIKTPTLIIYGEEDKNLGVKSYERLKDLPNSQVHVLPKAKHPCYLDQPDMFHHLVTEFIQRNTKD